LFDFWSLKVLLRAGAIPYDKETTLATGTPFEKPKIGDSIVDVIGGTPMVFFFNLHFRSLFISPTSDQIE
jgi:hypothetical protein